MPVDESEAHKPKSVPKSVKALVKELTKVKDFDAIERNYGACGAEGRLALCELCPVLSSSQQATAHTPTLFRTPQQAIARTSISFHTHLTTLDCHAGIKWRLSAEQKASTSEDDETVRWHAAYVYAGIIARGALVSLQRGVPRQSRFTIARSNLLHNPILYIAFRCRRSLSMEMSRRHFLMPWSPRGRARSFPPNRRRRTETL